MNIEKTIHEMFLEACETPKISRAKIITRLYYGNGLIATGCNSKKTHPLQKKFSGLDYKINLHAETAVIAKALKQFPYDNFKYMSLFVVRAKLTNERDFVSGIACPCEICWKLIKSLRINEVFYTTDIPKKFGYYRDPWNRSNIEPYPTNWQQIEIKPLYTELFRHGKDMEKVG